MGIFDLRNRRTVRAPVNPMDKCTIVSLLPKRIQEVKVTLQPSIFIIEPGSLEKPSLLVVSPASWWREVDERQPLLEITCSSIQIADSLIKDYCNGLIACNMTDAMPGLFFVPGAQDFPAIVKNHPKELTLAKEKQREWYLRLIRQADILWARTNGNPLSVPDDARLAAEQLGMKDKPWMGDFKHMELQNCKACGTLINPAYPMCSNCKTIWDTKRWAELGLKQAV